MTILADDDVIMHDDTHLGTDIGDGSGHVDIGFGRGRVAGRVIMREDDATGGKLQRPRDDLARIDRRMIDGPDLLYLIGDQRILLVEKQDAELLARLIGHCRDAIIHHLAPRA